VRGGGRTLWERAVNALAAHTPVWAGAFEPPHVRLPQEEALAGAAAALADAPLADWLGAVAALQKKHAGAAPAMTLVVSPGTQREMFGSMDALPSSVPPPLPMTTDADGGPMLNGRSAPAAPAAFGRYAASRPWACRANP
jgi:hypothetical protein